MSGEVPVQEENVTDTSDANQDNINENQIHPPSNQLPLTDENGAMEIDATVNASTNTNGADDDDVIDLTDDDIAIDEESNSSCNESVASQSSSTLVPMGTTPSGVARKSTGGRRKYVGERAMLAEAREKFPGHAFSTKRSVRIQSKKRKRYNIDGTFMLATDFESCDCLVPECAGCHMPCKKCGDRRCATDCRRGRRYVFQKVLLEGTDVELENRNVYPSPN